MAPNHQLRKAQHDHQAPRVAHDGVDARFAHAHVDPRLVNQGAIKARHVARNDVVVNWARKAPHRKVLR